MKNLSTEELIDELISASYESGYYARNQTELVSAAVTRRRNARRELERRLAPKSQDHMTTEPKLVHSPGYPQDESEFSGADELTDAGLTYRELNEALQIKNRPAVPYSVT